MSEYIPTESANVVIGICGEQASGKTVFLTCIFQSIWTAVPDDFILDFDRRDIGNASYFQDIENRVILNGPTEGTSDRSLFPVRLYVKPYSATPGKASAVLAVDLIDFAGRHFTSIADLKELKAESDEDPEDVKALRKVNETLEKADAFVVLINSREIDPINEVPSRNPFSPAVNFMLNHCRAERKPVALLFSQVDQTPLLTEELFHEMPRVSAFERQFTTDLAEATAGGRPFGIVKRISCYETVEGDLAPRRQTHDGSIWRPEPAEVVLTLLRAALPRINARLAQAAAVAREARERAEREAAEARRRWKMAGIAALVAIALLAVVAVWAYYQREERQQVRFLRQVQTNIADGKMMAISPSDQAALDAILKTDRAGGKAPPTVHEAIGDLQSALAAAVQRLVDGPVFNRAYGGEIAQADALLPLFDSENTSDARQKSLPLLEARSTFLSEWFGTDRRERRARTARLDLAARQFSSSGDPAFSALLSTLSTREKEAEVTGWQSRIDADAEVPARLVTMQNLLAGCVNDGDSEFTQLARKAIAVALVSSILKRHENIFIREKLLGRVAPDLAQFSDGNVRFEVLARTLLACANREDCAAREGVLDSVNTDADTYATGWSSGVDNLLRTLLLDLSVDQRRDVWGVVAGSLETSYVFSSRADAWPADIIPLHGWIRSRLDGGGDPTMELIERISRHPVYASELHYLKDHLVATEAERRVVSIYSNILTVLAQHAGPLPSDDLTSVSQQLSSIMVARNDVAAPLTQIGGEVEQILTLVRSVNNFWATSQFRPRNGGDAPAAPRLDRLLRDARRGHCTSLMTHDAPAECSNAA